MLGRPLSSYVATTKRKKMVNGAILTVKRCCYFWNTEKVRGDRSDVFKIQKNRFHFEFWTGWAEDSDYRLRLCSNEGRSVGHFDVTVHLKDTDSIPGYHTSVRENSSNIIWKSTKSDLSKILPGLEEESFYFMIIIERTAKLEHLTKPEWSQDFSKLQIDGPGNDVEITCRGHIFKAHKSVLSARSNVFATMLQSKMAEGKTGRVQIQDIEEDVFRPFLHFLYTGEMPQLTEENAAGLYEVADKYNVKILKKPCADFLINSLSEENACYVLAFFDRHSDPGCIEQVIQYMLTANIPNTADNWDEFCNRHPRLANEVINRFCHQLQLSIVNSTKNNRAF